MICKNCKTEFPDDKVYCPKCGTPVQVVPDYNVLDEEVLSSYLKRLEETGKLPSIEDGLLLRKKMPRKRLFVIIGVILVLASALLLSIGLYFSSYSYYLESGKEALETKSYDSAVMYFTKASKKAPEDGDAYYYLGLTASKEQDYDKAEDYYQKAIRIAPTHKKSYEALIQLYVDRKDYVSLEALKEKAPNDTIRGLFDSIVSGTVSFSKKGGTYESDLSLVLSTNGTDTIYYTLDGSNPSKKNGHIYRKPIEITDGETTVRAACINSKGKVGKVSENTYTINYSMPAEPTLSPEGGTYTQSTEISITSDEDCSIYYTWDGSDPTVSSTLYTGPITMPEGNNILSVISVNSHGMSSRVIRVNYIYLP
jgi:hypothetical protein